MCWLVVQLIEAFEEGEDDKVKELTSSQTFTLLENQVSFVWFQVSSSSVQVSSVCIQVPCSLVQITSVWIQVPSSLVQVTSVWIQVPSSLVWIDVKITLSFQKMH